MAQVEFMQSLKEGDTFVTVYHVGFQGRNKEAGSVVVRKITKTQIVISGLYGKEERYFLANGKRVGNHWDNFPMPATPEQVVAAKEDKETRTIRAALNQYKWDAVDLPKLRAIRDILRDKPEADDGSSL